MHDFRIGNRHWLGAKSDRYGVRCRSAAKRCDHPAPVGRILYVLRHDFEYLRYDHQLLDRPENDPRQFGSSIPFDECSGRNRGRHDPTSGCSGHHI